MAYFFVNPSDQQFHCRVQKMADATQSLFQFLMAFLTNYVYVPFIAFMKFLFYQAYIYLPLWIRYRLFHFRKDIRWFELSWYWWLTWIKGFWYEPPLAPGKKYNGTYWMNVHEDIYNFMA